ncbi:MAG: DNA primase, partial [Holosporaceae bacterium]|nr:DNA primase [Holosporaceae bacterium]
CPFHNEKTGSLKIDSDKGYYYCFGCGAHGDVITFVQNFDKISFGEAVEYLANFYGVPLPHHKEKAFTDPSRPVYDAMVVIKNWFIRQLNGPAGEDARQYIKSRGISPKSIEMFQLGFAPNDLDLLKHLRSREISVDVLLKTGVFYRSKYHGEIINRYSGRLIFPILDSIGKCVGFGGRIIGKDEKTAKYINSPESAIFVKSDHLYGYFLAKRGETRELILVEGYLDVISLHQAGFDGAVAPLGTSISETQINMCWNVSDNPIVSLDGDGAGIKASYRWVDKMLLSLRAGQSFRFAKLPQGADPNQLVSANQLDVVRSAISNAVPLSDWIWDGAFLLYPSETPEQKAAIVKMLISKAYTIPDVSVRKLYIQAIREKERDLYRSKVKIIAKKGNIRPVIPVKEKLEKIFIVTILNHPHIISMVIENLARLEPGDFQIRKLKERILDCYEQGWETYVATMALLKKEHEADFLDVELHAKFACADATDEEAAHGWLELVDKYLADPLMIADLQTATSNLKSTFSEDDWQRFRALKQELISRTQR